MRWQLLVAAVLAAGCFGGAHAPEAPGLGSALVLHRVVDDVGAPLAAQLTAYNGSRIIAAFSTAPDGTFAATEVPPNAEQLVVVASGFHPYVADAHAIPELIRLTRVQPGQPTSPNPQPGSTSSGSGSAGPQPSPGEETLEAMPDALPTGLFLSFGPAVSLPCDITVVSNCGSGGEPVLGIQPDGTIWASATTSLGEAPPIWVSRDGGLTFQSERAFGPSLVRHAVGSEGDFAVDPAGNVFFADVVGSLAWLTSWDAGGAWRWTRPFPLPHSPHSLVDRPWVVATEVDALALFYSYGTSSFVTRSSDGGQTWALSPQSTFDQCGHAMPLATDGPLHAVSSCGGSLTLVHPPRIIDFDVSGKASSSPLPMPANYVLTSVGLFVPARDSAGNTYYVYEASTDGGATFDIYLVTRIQAQVRGPFQLTLDGNNHLPSIIAGRDGHIGIAWYRANETTRDEWVVMAGVSVDADSEKPHFVRVLAQNEPVLKGRPLERNLGDFLSVALDPKGRLIVAYEAEDTPQRAQCFGCSDNRVAISTGNLRLL